MTQKASATNLRTFRTFLLMQQFAAREIGERIALARKEAGAMTQQQLAELLNVSTRSVQDYEAGTTIPWPYFQRLETIFKHSMMWFLHGDEDGQPAEVQRLLQELSESVDRLAESQGLMLDRLERIESALAPSESASTPGAPIARGPAPA